MPEMIAPAERDESIASEERALSGPSPQGLWQYDPDGAYLPDAVGGYVELMVSDSSTVTAESQEKLREIVTFMKERAVVDVWVTAAITSDSPDEVREVALAVEQVTRRLRELGVDEVPFRIWRPGERRTPPPQDVLEIRVTTSDQRPIS